jgi:hypothetical protein
MLLAGITSAQNMITLNTDLRKPKSTNIFTVILPNTSEMFYGNIRRRVTQSRNTNGGNDVIALKRFESTKFYVGLAVVLRLPHQRADWTKQNAQAW